MGDNDIDFRGNIDGMMEMVQAIDYIKSQLINVDARTIEQKAMLFDLMKYCVELKDRFVLGSSED